MFSKPHIIEASLWFQQEEPDQPGRRLPKASHAAETAGRGDAPVSSVIRARHFIGLELSTPTAGRLGPDETSRFIRAACQHSLCRACHGFQPIGERPAGPAVHQNQAACAAIPFFTSMCRGNGLPWLDEVVQGQEHQAIARRHPRRAVAAVLS